MQSHLVKRNQYIPPIYFYSKRVISQSNKRLSNIIRIVTDIMWRDADILRSKRNNDWLVNDTEDIREEYYQWIDEQQQKIWIEDY